MPNQHSGEKTKLMLANSLRKLMQKKPIDKIKIREIVDDCGVNRQTFYYHFQDIYALVEWIYERDAMMLVEENKGNDDWSNVVKEILCYIEEHRNEIVSVINSNAKRYFSDFVVKDLNVCIKEIIENLSADLDVDYAYKDFLANFYTMAVCGVVEGWLMNSDSSRMSSAELVHMLDITTSGNIRASLLKCNRKH